MFGKKEPPSRSQLVAQADRARAKGKLKQAIQGYRKALELEPKDPAVLGKLAPLLARTKETEASLKSFREAAQGHLDKGFADKALAVYTQAAETFPTQVGLWQQVSRMNMERGHRADAVRILLRGRFSLRRKNERAEAILLLKDALALDPTLFAPRLDLARLLAQQHLRAEAMALLEPMEKSLEGGSLRQVRWTMLRVSPGLGAGWRWLRAAVLGR
ncbi:tetratricopeptide repeat protein [Stigmatella aurantiaca]|uniref:TPR domain protein n=1 Tax=Stigmatella aurantiaca (strain DW4/3-1) TaxID=378806 RepID=Q08MK7_STIAD|nr:tetratricopeptide repeat protein [Stigmatella aurantiaca]ADO71318.1 TPR domain protein [Stigmatella aurantiaca DW4/3-1]EAU61713.1 TPR domain protein, putative [Stigmatella aurantiaca DW4/3-1]